MLATLLKKDFRRTLRNPWPWLLNLALPIAITAVIGFAFGGAAKKENAGVKIKFALVDEDKGLMGRALRVLLSQEESAEHLTPVYLPRDEALRILRENEISAIVVIPKEFTKRYVAGEAGLKLEVIKNPAQSFMPAIVEEFVAVGVTVLNAVSRNLQSEFGKTNSFEWIGARLKGAKDYLDPPLIGYAKEVKEAKKEPAAAKGGNVITTVFGYVLPGMVSAFLLFIADQSMRDFHREIRMKTFARQRTLGIGAGVYITGKIVFTAVTVALAAAVLMGGGSLIFGIEWRQPGLLALACAAYSLFAAGFLAALTALLPTERRAETVNSMLLFGIAFAGGSYLPAENFPAAMRDNVTAYMPNQWLIQACHALQRGDADLAPVWAVLKLAVAGIVMGATAAAVLNRRLTKGVRA